MKTGTVSGLASVLWWGPLVVYPLEDMNTMDCVDTERISELAEAEVWAEPSMSNPLRWCKGICFPVRG